MSDIKRYELISRDYYGDALEERADGEYVAYVDHRATVEAQAQRIAELEGDNASLHRTIKTILDAHDIAPANDGALAQPTAQPLQPLYDALLKAGHISDRTHYTSDALIELVLGNMAQAAQPDGVVAFLDRYEAESLRLLRLEPRERGMQAAYSATMTVLHGMREFAALAPKIGKDGS